MSDTPSLLGIKQFSEKHRAWSPAALRAYVLNSEDRVAASGQRVTGNGLAEAGAIIRIGRRVLLDEQAFFRWIAEQQKSRHKAKAAG